MQFLLGTIVAFAMLSLLIGKGVIWYTEWTMKRLIETKHRDSEFIIATGEPPPYWIERLQRRLRTHQGERSIVRLSKRGKRVCDKRITALIDYFTHSPLIENEDTRHNLLKKLEAVRRDWRERDARGLLEPQYRTPYG